MKTVLRLVAVVHGGVAAAASPESMLRDWVKATGGKPAWTHMTYARVASDDVLEATVNLVSLDD